jgi:CRP/FNR family transcriptional regulator
MGSPRVIEPFVDCLLEQLESEGFICSLPSRAILFMEGDVPRGIHIISKGHVKLTVSSREGRVLIVNIADPGEILGLHNCITGTPYEMTAQTLQSSRVSFVKREELMWLLRNNPQACVSATERLSRTCHSALSQVGSFQFAHSASEKLARFLLTLSAESASAESSCSEKDCNAPVRVEMDLTHDEIAQAIGASRETVTRALAAFRKKQLANLTRSMLLVKNRAELERIAGMASNRSESVQRPSGIGKRSVSAVRPLSPRWSAVHGNGRQAS